MGTSQNWLRAKAVVERMRLTDLAWAARQDVLRLRAAVTPPAAICAPTPALPRETSGGGGVRAAKSSFVELHQFLAAAAKSSLQDQLAQDLARPEHPLNWHRNRVAEEMSKPAAHEIYFRMRQALWHWAEFASVPRRARAILEVVIELAREEAFPWYLPVPADEVRRLARLTEVRYSTSVRALDVLSISKSARILQISDETGFAHWERWAGAQAGAEANSQACAASALPSLVSSRADPIAQWVVRYRRGVPWHKHRAAWWLNYDLFCGTGRVLACFVTSPASLPQTYQARNTPMGRVRPALNSEDGLAALERMLTKRGPLPPAGMRAPLWRAL